jgi:hypothetical protein
MRWEHIDPLVRPGFQPTRWDPATGKYKRVNPLRVDDSEFEINVIRCGCYGLPLRWNKTCLGAFGALGITFYAFLYRTLGTGTVRCEYGYRRR